MTDTFDPTRVHEILALAMLLLLLPTAAVAFAYLRTLGAFLGELKQEEPDVWQRVGAPGMVDMMVLPLRRFRKYYAFYPVLRERAATGDERYRFARRAYRLLKVGLVMTAALFVLGGATIAWMARYDL